MNLTLAMVTNLKEVLDHKRPMNSHTLHSLQKDYILRCTYHSNAIEGNTLTLNETKAILEDGITIGQGKSLKEHLEVINHRDAILYVENTKNNQITERDIRNIHAIILRGIDEDTGSYRGEEVLIQGASHNVTPSYLIKEHMNDLMNWYETSIADSEHPIVRAAMLHSKFVNVHPFLDGNGRTGRLIMNLELVRCGYLPVIAEVESRQDYYKALDVAGEKGDFSQIIDYIMEREVRALEMYLGYSS
ncbi:hypothetical protein DH09_00670 (plasmid) [Bacillaceae bacterium JMAK1]|nr:hypothetical protein DH09_00670 [Bacillaceae bacterium JMAK1]